jgi:hypothetical protein
VGLPGGLPGGSARGGRLGGAFRHFSASAVSIFYATYPPFLPFSGVPDGGLCPPWAPWPIGILGSYTGGNPPLTPRLRHVRFIHFYKIMPFYLLFMVSPSSYNFTPHRGLCPPVIPPAYGTSVSYIFIRLCLFTFFSWFYPLLIILPLTGTTSSTCIF